MHALKNIGNFLVNILDIPNKIRIKKLKKIETKLQGAVLEILMLDANPDLEYDFTSNTKLKYLDLRAELLEISEVEDKLTSIVGDVRDFEKLKNVFEEYRPEFVFHLAAQPIVRDSYKEPRYTYDTNVMGTVNVLECVRLCSCVKSVLNVTTDKVYHNNEWSWGYRENDPLDGYDPYSNSNS